MSAKSSFIIVFSLLYFLLFASCSGEDSTENGEPQYQPGDYDTAPDGDRQGGDGDEDDGVLPDCTSVCFEYCSMLKNCSPAFDQQQYYQCREACRDIAANGKWESEISCAAAQAEKDCVSFNKCTKGDGLDGWLCNPGRQNGDGDGADDGDIEDNVSESCLDEGDCKGDTHCDPASGTCRPACNLYYPQCPDGQSCRLLTEGQLAGLGYGVCVETWSGKAEGAICQNSDECAPGLLCGYTAQCEKICDPASGEENICDYRLNCTPQLEYGVGTCAFCINDDQCSGALVCEDGYCVEEWECHRSEDCNVSGQGCFHGKCKAGCSNDNQCQPGGACDTTQAYCYGDSCAENCVAQGKCCNRHECGPCCAQQCQLGQTCAYDARCYPELFCCVEPADCREKPEGYCGANPCSLHNGACGGACPVTCNWGYGCGLWSGFDCKPLPPEPCSMVGMNCEGDFACMMCNGETLGEAGQCVATEDCPISRLDEGMSCYIDPLFSLECRAGHTCCLGEDGKYTCCPQEKCINGRGCVEPGYIPPGPYTCKECDRLAGDWEPLDNEGGCPVKWDRLVIKRDEDYDCFFVLYHDSATWANRLVDISNCDNQVLLHDSADGAWSECVLFLDALSDRMTYVCKNSQNSCRISYSKR